LVGSTAGVADAPPAVALGSGGGGPSPAAVAAVGGPVTRFGWPLVGLPRPVRRFDPPPQPWLPGHRGVDLAASPGAQVRAAGPGIVLFAGPIAGRPVVTVGHADGLRTTYEPVLPGLSAGARVATGTPIGNLLAGHPGCPAEACLHWGLRRGEEYLDPLALLGLGPVRLLPLDPADRTPSGMAAGVTGAPPGPPARLATTSSTPRRHRRQGPSPRDPAGDRAGGAGAGQPWASSAGRRTASRSYSSGVL
jgi:murein DD-endopeptidase MepM/ murein hydrolase activator NlpD